VRLDEDLAWHRLTSAASAVLVTIGPDGAPDPVPFVFTTLPGHRLLTAVDQKPKSGRRLARLDNIEADARVAVLADHYDDDWSRLWWVRADGIASVTAERPPEAPLLEDRYPAYRTDPPHGPWIEIDVRALTGWSAS